MDFGFRLQRGLSPRRIGIDPRPVRVENLVDKLALGQVSLGVLLFSPVSIIPLLLHTHSFTYYRR
jgi:hypothetical protein